MTLLIVSNRRSSSSRPYTKAHHLFIRAGLTAMLGLMVGTLAFTPAVCAQTSDHAYHIAADSAYMPNHMYLYNADGTVTDVTDSYMQTGTVYDAQKGYTVQTGHVTGASGSSLDVTVDAVEGNIGDWKGKTVGFIAQQAAPFTF